jgi:hypothetical protein
MSDSVNFSRAAVEDHRRAGVSFMASVDGRPVHCVISARALEDYYHADPKRLEAAYQAHREEIEGVAEALIRVRAIHGGELRIDLAELESPSVAFEQSVRQSIKPVRKRPPKG